MEILLKIENRFLSLCQIQAEFNEKGKNQLQASWIKAEQFIAGSNYAGKCNLIIDLSIDGKVIFEHTKVKYKDIKYQNVFHLLSNFIKDKLYFYQMLDDDTKKDFYSEYQENKANLSIIKRLDFEMRRSC